MSVRSLPNDENKSRDGICDRLTQAQLQDWLRQASHHARLGRLPHHVPVLAQADPAWIAAQICLVNGQSYRAGLVHQPFALMSVVKPFLLLFLLEHFGAEFVFRQVGDLPSEQPFNSLAQLTTDRGWARNPMINSGAIVLASQLKGTDAHARCEVFRQWLNQHTEGHWFLDPTILASVESLKNEVNWQIAKLLAQAGYVTNIELAIATYNHLCCLSGNICDLAQMGLLLAKSLASISSLHQQIVNQLMLTCGLYEDSAKFAAEVGFPTKSGISGALLAIVPGEGAIACYSPPLDNTGNSIAGMFLLEQIASIRSYKSLL
ncbi:MAG: glutaminase [Scytolyngbya sp. HA4215-MV1]|jgi:glutaminase|nr:glutaminase [Scytolyngbya sp. HA4215-MV1]